MVKGQITVVLSLVIAVIMSLFVTMLEGVRVSAIWGKSNVVAQVGMESIFGEFHRELLDQYELFYIDTSYLGDAGGIENTISNLEEFTQMNIEKTKDKWYLPRRNFLKLNIEGISPISYHIASDYRGKTIKQQAISSYISKYGITYVADCINNLNIIESEGLNSRDIRQEQEELKNEAYEIVEDNYVADDSNEQSVDKDNFIPEEYVITIIDLVSRNRGRIKNLSYETIDLQQSTYYRNLANGVYGGETTVKTQHDSLIDEMIFNAYLFDKCSYYTRELSKSKMKYQIEYILKGHSKDKDNLNSVLTSILGIREVSNYIQIQNDGARVSVAKTISTAISALVVLPELEPIITQIILMGWSHKDSLDDIETLVSGGSVPLISKGGKGLKYKDYLMVFMLMKYGDKKTCRFMDIVESDIRKTTAINNFKLDNCVDYLSVDFSFKSDYGYSTNFQKRKEYYE